MDDFARRSKGQLHESHTPMSRFPSLIINLPTYLSGLKLFSPGGGCRIAEMDSERARAGFNKLRNEF